MKILEYAEKLWVDISGNPVRDDTPFLCIGPKTYIELNIYFKRKYNLNVVYATYISKNDGVYLSIELKDKKIEFNIFSNISDDFGNINIGVEEGADEDHPNGYVYLYICVPIDQEVETFNID